jgi:DNA mismatch repair ATPase MutL
MISGRAEIREAYRNEAVARQYVEARFREPLGAMLHARQVHAVKRVIADRQPQRVLQEALVTLAGNTHGLVIEHHASWAERLAVVVACRSAVRAGDVLAQAEMEALLRRLGEASLCRTCAHGRPTALLLSHAQLEREFGRR